MAGGFLWRRKSMILSVQNNQTMNRNAIGMRIGRPADAVKYKSSMWTLMEEMIANKYCTCTENERHEEKRHEVTNAAFYNEGRPFKQTIQLSLRVLGFCAARALTRRE